MSWLRTSKFAQFQESLVPDFIFRETQRVASLASLITVKSFSACQEVQNVHNDRYR